MINLLIQITPITVVYPQVERQLINFWGKVNETLKIVEPQGFDSGKLYSIHTQLL